MLKSMLSRIAKGQTIVETGLVNVSLVAIMVMIVLTTADVILRYVFNNPIPGTFEVEAMLIVFVVFLSLAYIQSRRAHIRVDVLISHLPPVGQLYLSIVGHFISLSIFGVIAWQGGVAAHEAWVTGDYTMGLIPYPFWPAKWALAIGVAFFCLRFVSDIVVDVGRLRIMLRKSPAGGAS